MANGPNETTTTSTAAQPGEQGFQQTMDNLMAASGFAFGDIYSPSKQFTQFAGGQFTPGLRRDAFYNMQAPLTQQYLLSAAGVPAGLEQPMSYSGYSPGGSFSNFLGNYNPLYGLPGMGGRSQLLSLADAINQYGAMTGEQQQAYYDAPGTFVGTTGIQFNPLQQALMRSQYGQGTQAGIQNRAALANMLATQRGGDAGGQYGGILGGAITSMLQDMYTQYQGSQAAAKVAPLDYLYWYLSADAPRFGTQA